MEYMPLAEFIKYGTPLMLLALIILNVYQATVIGQLKDELKALKNSITWGDTCTERHKRVDERLTDLEKMVFRS